MFNELKATWLVFVVVITPEVTVNAVETPTLIELDALISPTTSRVVVGFVVPIPTLLVDWVITKAFVFTPTLPFIVKL